MVGFHVTTSKKLQRYELTGGILPPVRFWPTIDTAKRWCKRVNRDFILEIDCLVSHPLPDHKPARWTPELIRKWKCLNI